MKKSKENNLKNLETEYNNFGITLIALVITIIVLLILAGVSIEMVFKGDGLFSRADDSKVMHENGQLYENLTLRIQDLKLSDKLGGVATNVMNTFKGLNYIDEEGIVNVNTLSNRRMQTGTGNREKGNIYVIKQLDGSQTGEYYLFYYNKNNEERNIGKLFVEDSEEIKVSYKKTPIIIGNQTVAVKIDIMVSGKTKTGKILSEEQEIYDDIKNFLNGKSEAELEKIINEVLKYNSNSHFPFKNLQEIYTEEEVSSLQEYGEKRQIQDLCQYLGISLSKGAVLNILFNDLEGYAFPYYGKTTTLQIVSLWNSTSTKEITSNDYVCGSLSENVSEGYPGYVVYNNGTYEFEVFVSCR